MIYYTPGVVGAYLAADAHLFAAWFSLLAPAGTPAWLIAIIGAIGEAVLVVLLVRYSWRWLSRLPDALMLAGYKSKSYVRRVTNWSCERKIAVKKKIAKWLESIAAWLAKEQSRSARRRPVGKR